MAMFIVGFVVAFVVISICGWWVERFGIDD
jgi:hypothetical protein